MTLASRDRTDLPEGAMLLDCTIRDGSYAVDFQFEDDFAVELLAGLGETSVPLVEIGHGLGLEAERAGVRACSIADERWCEIAGSTLGDKQWGMFAQPSFTRGSSIAAMCDRGMSFVRVGMEAEKVADNLGYLDEVADACPRVYLNLMKTSDTALDRLLPMLEGVRDDLAGVYVVDSHGTMLPADVRAYVSAVARHFDTVGFHGHNNLGMANVNSITALQSGALIADGTLNGIGRGAGNAELESLAGIIAKTDRDRFGYRQLARLAEFCRANMRVVPEDRTMQVFGGVIGIHSGYFPLVSELSEKTATDPAVLMETAAGLTDHSPTKDHFHRAAALLAHRAAA
ncbi:beta/alpha barrel domain-containing protein [Actinokineospora spheciospongiae]|uniref:hypothetical protein n=1 Tax=Actinokineospora spheciospongiae TaxID=909613 RepID=UPI000D8356C2|nr:hypothetical protein [Actinokineospora spheciospongiae]PWW56172.1 4-hydroxy 2-oxovalerate aldolase [Actinokineospora spheciospongiae]